MFTQLGPKNLEILHELVPNAVVIGALVNPNNPNAEPQLRDLQASAHMLGLRLVTFAARSVSEIDSVFATLPEHKIAAMLVTADAYFFGLQHELVPRAARHAVPTVFPLSDYVAAGGLVGYVADLSEIWRPNRSHLLRDDKGTTTTPPPRTPATKIELVFNTQTPEGPR